MKVVTRKNESSQGFSSTGYESFSITQSTSGQNKRDLLYLFRKLNVNQKYIDILIANNYKYDDFEKLSEEEFAQKFFPENKEELEKLEEIFIKLKSETLPESCEMERVISVSNSGIDDDHSQNYSNNFNMYQQYGQFNLNQQLKSSSNNIKNGSHHIKQSSFLNGLNNLGNFNEYSQYQFEPVNNNTNNNQRDQSLALPQSVANLSQTKFYNVKQLPYNPFEFTTTTYITSSITSSPQRDFMQTSSNSKINPSIAHAVLNKLNQVADVIYKNNTMFIDDISFKNNILRSHMYLRISEKSSPEKYITKYSRILYFGDTIKIGRHSSSDIILNSDQVSRNHAIIHAVDDKYYVKDLGSSSGTYVKLKADQQYQLVPSSIFRCGITEFKITRMVLEEDVAKVQIQIIMGNKKNTVFDFDVSIKQSKNCAIGTNIQCEISAIDNIMEKYHASLSFKKGFVYLTDLSSASGTWIRLSNQGKESEDFQLLDGQIISISPYLITGFIHTNSKVA
ncbi:hypothetical protein ABPG74_010424 [Tetrahymena malaccensis]